jgi:2'-5' RNA ligase
MTEVNAPSELVPLEGRRVLVAVITGPHGEAIQRWREVHDPGEARRIPPHATLCYWATGLPADALERQVRHAFPAPVTVQLGPVAVFDSRQATFYVQVREAEELDAARRRLYDGTHLAIEGFNEWTWHISCVRESLGRDLSVLREAARELHVEGPCAISTIALMELRGDTYADVARWTLGG